MVGWAEKGFYKENGGGKGRCRGGRGEGGGEEGGEKRNEEGSHFKRAHPPDIPV